MATTTTAPTSAFATKPLTSGFTLGGGDVTSSTGTTGLTFGVPNTMVTGTGFNLGGAPATTTTSTPTTTAATGFSLNTSGTTSTPVGFSFGGGTLPASTTGFSLNKTAAAPSLTTTTTPTSAFATKPVTSGFTLGGGEVTPSTGTTGLTFGVPNTMVTGTGFNLGGAPAATTTSAPTTTAATGFSLSASGTTSAPVGFSFGGGTLAASTAGFSLNKTSAAPSLTTPSTQISLATTTTVSSSASAGQPASINSFEESINKWTLELEEQEKVFVNQAAQVNAWDKLLITNGEEIVALNQEVERVKIEQQQLEHELDYVVGQQKELQDCLVPLEKELASLSVSDPEREYTYRLAEDLDTQLKRMSEDLKEIIEHLNEANRTQDSSDPIVQIGKILNAHMNSLQWLDQQTSMLNQKIQQIDQMHQNFRQENERSFSLAYN
ncbi:nucleoporin 62 [Andrena cerasifolii]|uniref:nucleoporin 62 n=1 Tax=Andrena cerasifolii TaxID=2819439 RepID=UPI0040381C3F